MHFGYYIYFFICFILFITQIILAVLSSKTKKSTLWNILFGITISKIISCIIVHIGFFNDTDIDLGIGIVIVIWRTIFIITNLLFLIISIIIKAKSKKQIKFNKYSIITGIIFIIVSILLTILIPKTEFNTGNKYIKEKVIDFLNKKYGDNDYKIESIEKDYSYNGIVQKYHTGYTAKVYYPEKDLYFFIDIEGTDPKNPLDFSEGMTTFIERYYMKEINDFLSKKYNIEFDYLNIETNNIPTKYGHIPTFDELIDLKVIDSTKSYGFQINEEIKYNSELYLDENKRIERVKDVTLDLIDYLNITKNICILYQYYNKNSDGQITRFYYIVKKNDNKLIIYEEDNKDNMFEYDINIKTTN